MFVSGKHSSLFLPNELATMKKKFYNFDPTEQNSFIFLQVLLLFRRFSKKYIFKICVSTFSRLF